MIHKVSVVKKIMFLLMTMALAVAMVACSGAAGTPGPAGPPGKDAPTPDPTTPTTPTTPTEPAGPTGAAPVAKMIPDVYLALEGTGKQLTKAIGLDKYITDADSRIKYSAMSSAPTVATATLSVGGRSVTITAQTVGTATITVEARDGDNDPVEASISVTVVRSNALPFTNDLSPAAKEELEKILYVSDGIRTDTITVVANPGSTSSESLADSITGFEVKYGAKKALTSTLVTVRVAVVTDKYVISVTPTQDTLTSKDRSQMVMIYPKDKFETASLEAWEFNAVFNTPPKAIVDSFGTIRLIRPATLAGAIPPTVGTIDGNPVDDSVNVDTIIISDYFESLQRMGNGGTPFVDPVDGEVKGNATATPSTTLAQELAKIDDFGDTECEVSTSASLESLAIVQRLNEAGAIGGLEDAAATTPAVERDITDTDLLITSDHALAAIRIDSRVTSFGKDKIRSGITAPGDAAIDNDDTPAKGEGSFAITIRCTDPDDTAEVTGMVVVQDA